MLLALLGVGTVEIAAAAAYAPTSCRNSFTVFSFAFEYVPVASLRHLVFSHVLSRSFFLNSTSYDILWYSFVARVYIMSRFP